MSDEETGGKLMEDGGILYCGRRLCWMTRHVVPVRSGLCRRMGGACAPGLFFIIEDADDSGPTLQCGTKNERTIHCSLLLKILTTADQRSNAAQRTNGPFPVLYC
jgi:hypothetical protein